MGTATNKNTTMIMGGRKGASRINRATTRKDDNDDDPYNDPDNLGI